MSSLRSRADAVDGQHQKMGKRNKVASLECQEEEGNSSVRGRANFTSNNKKHTLVNGSSQLAMALI